jgi:hypothetical protein
VINTFKTKLPPHVIRRAAFEMLAPKGADYGSWIEHQFGDFMRRNGYARRDATTHAAFDKHLENRTK